MYSRMTKRFTCLYLVSRDLISHLKWLFLWALQLKTLMTLAHPCWPSGFSSSTASSKISRSRVIYVVAHTLRTASIDNLRHLFVIRETLLLTGLISALLSFIFAVGTSYLFDWWWRLGIMRQRNESRVNGERVQWRPCERWLHMYSECAITVILLIRWSTWIRWPKRDSNLQEMHLPLMHLDLDRNYHEGLTKGKDQCMAPIALDHFGRGDFGIIWYHMALKLCKWVWKNKDERKNVFFCLPCLKYIVNSMWWRSLEDCAVFDKIFCPGSRLYMFHHLLLQILGWEP